MRGRYGGRAGECDVVDDFDALPRSRLVRVLILLCRVLVEDLDTLDIHGIWLRWGNWCHSSAPSLCSSIGVTSIPKTKTDFHRGLWILVAIAVSVGRVEGANNHAVNGPRQGCG